MEKVKAVIVKLCQISKMDKVESIYYYLYFYLCYLHVVL